MATEKLSERTRCFRNKCLKPRKGTMRKQPCARARGATKDRRQPVQVTRASKWRKKPARYRMESEPQVLKLNEDVHLEDIDFGK